MSSTAPAPAPSRRTSNDQRMFGLLREIRAACQHVQDRIAEVLANAAGAPAGQRDAEIIDALADVADRVDAMVSRSLLKIQQVFDSDAEQFEWCADSVATMLLTWQEIKAAWPPEKSTENAEPTLNRIVKALDHIVYQCASLTISPRVNDVLANLRVGQPLDLEFEFGSELPKDPDLRKRIVMELAQECGVVDCGIVDVEHGQIYKTAPTRRQQLYSIWRLLGWIAVGFAIPLLLAEGGRILQGWPLKSGDLERLLVDYALILIGSGAHLAVEALKSSKSKKQPSFGAMDDLVLWAHIREASLRNGIVYVWLGYILLVVGVPGVEWSTAFFAGYSVDSVTEVFLERFETIVGAKTSELVK